MATEITVPTLGESLSEATVATWLKAVGDSVNADEPILELETDKVTIEVNAPAAGILTEIAAEEGAEVVVGALLGVIGEGTGDRASAPAAAPAAEAVPAPAAGGGDAVEIVVPMLGESIAEATVATWFKAVGDTVAADEVLLELETDKVTLEVNAPAAPAPSGAGPAVSPAVRKLIEENGLDAAAIPGTGKDGRVTKGDVLSYLKNPPAAPVAPAPAAPAAPEAAPGQAMTQIPSRPAGPREERVKMTRLRQVIAERLKTAQNTAAMLTTFNEVDMTAVMATRAAYRDRFEKTHGVRLGFMSYFVKASIVALKDFPAVNAEIDGTDLVYKNHYDVGVAVGTPQGLVVPVLRDADQMSFADVEKTIRDFGGRARDGKLTIDEMTGGTFTITNGGIYGSMLSTPILNAPQSGILGMHLIVERAMVVNGEIAIRPIMYVALSYDHRIVDGREAVSVLVRIKECIEDPQRIMLDM